MKLILTRKHFLTDCTIGTLEEVTDTPTIRVYLCDTLEPTYRNLAKESKLEGKTAIPFGTYEIEMGMSRKYRMTMPYLKNVPFFKGIMIHSGNFPKDTHGCILVGVNPPPTKGGAVAKVINSRMWMHMLRNRIKKAVAAGERVTVMITR